MLHLATNDLGTKACSNGVTGIWVWWEVPPERKRGVFTMAWGDLVLIRPKVVWPTGYHPERELWWGKHAARISYVDTLHWIVSQEVAQVPAVDYLHDVLPKKSDYGLKWTRSVAEKDKVSLARLDAKTGNTYCVAKRSLQRAANALDKRPRDLDLRLHLTDQSLTPAGCVWVVLVYQDGLRAVIPALDHLEVVG